MKVTKVMVATVEEGQINLHNTGTIPRNSHLSPLVACKSMVDCC